jgi:hypothetical protein
MEKMWWCCVTWWFVYFEFRRPIGKWPSEGCQQRDQMFISEKIAQWPSKIAQDASQTVFLYFIQCLSVKKLI